MFDRNYYDFEELVKVACDYCKVTVYNEDYSQIVALCFKYFWGNLYKPEFMEKINEIKERVNNE